MSLKSLELWEKINVNIEPEHLEKRGFIRGEQKGKNMSGSMHDIHKGLLKQWHDYTKAYNDGDSKAIKRTLADLCNVAGCLFLKLQEKDE